MKQYLLLTISFLLISMTVFAQSVVIVDPNPAYGEGDAAEVDINAHAFLKNQTNAEIRVGWRIMATDMPDAWESWICDNNLCYGPSTTEIPDDRPVVLGGGLAGIMDAHVDPVNVAGEGTMWVEIFMFDDPTMVLDTGVYTFTALLTDTEDLEDRVEDVSVFPNPTTNYIMLDQADMVDRMVIYNVLGKQMKHFEVNPGAAYDVAELPTGFYLLSLLDEENSILKTLRLNKR